MKLRVLLVAFVFGTILDPAAGAPWPDPWREPQDSVMAVSVPDQYAWRLFVALNWPADVQDRTADQTRPFGSDGPVVWESWKNARDVFLPKGADPGPWITPGPIARRLETDFDPLPLQQVIRARGLRRSGITPLFDPVAAQRQRNETRLNKETYEFVHTQELYNLDGQLKLVLSNASSIAFPLAAKETKAQWREIPEQNKSRYHWTELTLPNGSKKIYGLTALHITTKDLPNWFWATFEHVDNPRTPGNEPWLIPSKDSFACGSDPADCNRAPPEIGLENTKWQNYRLRGTQIEFTNSTGTPTLLANSQPESGFQQTSSCMTCHARSTVGLINGKPQRLSVFNAIGQSYNGPPNEDWFTAQVDDESGVAVRVPVFTQLDFVWSLFRAQPRTP